MNAIQAAKERFFASPWARLLAKGGLYGLGFMALALVGSGRWLSWVPPARGESTPPVLAASSAIAPASASASASVRPAAPSDSASAPPAEDAGAPEPAVTADGKVSVNRATEADLRRLPGVGATRAKAILALREKMGGRFKRAEDLLRVKGIGRKSLARLRPLLVID